MTWIYVGIAGSLGALARYGVSFLWLPDEELAFPWGTLICNYGGSFFICLLAYGSTPRMNPSLRLAIMVGFLGSFTTFSAFSYEVLTMLQHEQGLLALGYLMSSMCGGVLFAWLGYRMAVYSAPKGV
jgi:CrcB protein